MSDHSSGAGWALAGLVVGILGLGVAAGAGFAALAGLGCG